MSDDKVEVVISQPSEGKRKRRLKLYRAAVKGDWEIAKSIFENNPEDIQERISKYGDTALHIAAAAGRTRFVKELLKSIHVNKELVDYLAIKNAAGKTAFCFAATSGNMELVDFMLEKNEELASTRSQAPVAMLPIQMAALSSQEKMVKHLYDKAANGEDEVDLIRLLVTLINNNLYDTALLLLKKHPELAIATLTAENEEPALHALARRPTSSELANPNQQGIFTLFSGMNMVHNERMHPKALKLVEILWENATTMLDDEEISTLIGSPWMIIFTAAEHGNVQFLSELINKYPDLIFKVNKDGYSIFHIAVLYRHERIFNLIYETGSIKDLIVVLEDNQGNNILHLAAKLPPPNRLNIVSGAALQFKRELLWFKEVEKAVQPLYADAENKDKKTPRALFSDEHEKLREKGEEWMKKTAESCMIVAALITTVVFAAAFTVPGGLKEDTGSPNFLKKVSFIIFSISDAISLVCSSCSILTFLSILTSRYTEDDFLLSLPTKLVLGISTLFVSIAAMMMVFCVTLFILFKEGMLELAIIATVLASIPVFLFLWQQHRLLYDVVCSTYISDSLFSQKNISNSLFSEKKQTDILQKKTNPGAGSY